MTNGQSTPKIRVQAQGLGKSFATKRGPIEALRGVNLTVRDGEFVSVIGPSGCGKSTLFNIMSGVVLPDEGRLLIDGDPRHGEVGHVGYMPQKDLLLPWRTVLDNVILGMEVSGTSRAEARREARGLMSGFGLAGFESSYPYELSGGMRQRAAFLRTVLFRRDILLLDEPFGALDALTRTAMHEWLLEVWGKLGQTILFVTHDVEEAVLLSDRVYVMTARPGRIKAEVTIDLPRPRSYRLIVDPRFLDHKVGLLDALREERTRVLNEVA